LAAVLKEKCVFAKKRRETSGLVFSIIDKMFACYVVVVTKMFPKCPGLNSLFAERKRVG
jgi:hypothetical protein